MRIRRLLATPVVAGMVISMAHADTSKLGKEYEAAAPAAKLALLAVAQQDRVLERDEARKTVSEVAGAEVARGKTAEVRLTLLRDLMKAAAAELGKLNKERQARKKPSASSIDAPADLQQALALAYVADAAGPKPTLDKLAALSLVRGCTDWSATTELVRAWVVEALSRDEDYAKADAMAKLEYLRTRVVERGLVSDHERHTVETTIVAEWMLAQLGAGKPGVELAADVKKLQDAKKICFFTFSWADGMLKRVRAVSAPAPASPSKLGKEYEEASAAAKLALLAVAQQDRVLKRDEVREAADAVTVAEVSKGKTSEERLRLLGDLRRQSLEKVKAGNEERKAQKKATASSIELPTALQGAIALAYVADAAGATPTIEKLACLKLVRECTSSEPCSALATALVLAALPRDATYMKADVAGKLEYVRTRIADPGLMGDMERTTVEKPILCEWMVAQLAAGQSGAQIMAELGKLYGAKLVCTYSHFWALPMLERVHAGK